MTAIDPVVAARDVYDLVQRSGSSFHAGMAVLPKNRRQGMYALYAFCRVVDDIADDSPSPEISRAGLDLWRKRIADLFRDGTVVDSVTACLATAIRDFSLVEQDFQAIIDGMAMDADGAIVAPDLQLLDLYCDRVASAVGRVSVRIFGDSSDHAMQVAYHLGRALQLTNIVRDVAEDAMRGRLYLPRTLLHKAGITDISPEKIVHDSRLADVCRDVAALALEHYAAADAAMALCNRKAMRPARIMRAYYGAILDQLLVEAWANPEKRVRLGLIKKIGLILSTVWG